MSNVFFEAFKTVNVEKSLERLKPNEMFACQYIYDKIGNVDVSKNECFQEKYNFFYRIRRVDEWKVLYYSLLEESKKKPFDFKGLIYKMYNNTNEKYIETVYVTKLIATINSNMPIWDSHVALKTNIKHSVSRDPIRRIEINASRYSLLVKDFDEYMRSDDAKKKIAAFDKRFEEFKNIPNAKKIDFILWASI